MRKLYAFTFDCQRLGRLKGLFIAEEHDVDLIIGQHVYFGEVLGKHSDISGNIDNGEIVEKSDDQELISKLEMIFGGRTISGYNPFDYLSE